MNFNHNLIEVKPNEREAVFKIVGEDRTETFPVSSNAPEHYLFKILC